MFLKRRQDALCPVRALNAWIQAAELYAGPLFPNRHNGEHANVEPLSDKAVSLIVKRHVAAIGLDPVRFSGHSLRAGFATSAALARVDPTIIARQTVARIVQLMRSSDLVFEAVRKLADRQQAQITPGVAEARKLMRRAEAMLGDATSSASPAPGT